MSDSLTLLRHTLATLAYRGGKSIRDVGTDFANYGQSETARTPAKILAHMGDLMDWALAMSEGREIGATLCLCLGKKKSSDSSPR